MSGPSNGQVVLKTGPAFKAILVSLIRIVDKLAAMATDDLERAPVGAAPPAPAERPPRAVYGFCLRTMAGHEGLLVERFGNVRRNPEGGDPIVTALREPLTEMHDCGEYLELRMEVPGIREEDLQIESAGQQLRLFARRGDYEYSKEMSLPVSCDRARLEISCHEGLLEIRCPK